MKKGLSTEPYSAFHHINNKAKTAVQSYQCLYLVFIASIAGKVNGLKNKKKKNSSALLLTASAAAGRR